VWSHESWMEYRGHSQNPEFRYSREVGIDQDTIHRVARGASGPTKLALFGEEDKNFQKAPFDAAVQLAFHPTILLSMSFILFSDVKFPQLCLLRESAGISQSPFYSI